MKVYAFMYNDNIYDSSDAVMSLHISPKGAEKAMNEHKEKALIKFKTYQSICNQPADEFFNLHVDVKDEEFGIHESWSIKPFEVYE
jgi:hypothetical protein